MRFFPILGTPISIISMDQALSILDEWRAGDRDRFVALRDVHGIMRAREEPALDSAHHMADMVCPDGMPIVWAVKSFGIKDISRVCGPDLLLTVCESGLTRGWRHYFYGGSEGVAEAVANELSTKFPGLIVVGIACPPFRTTTIEEDELACASIRSAQPDFVWVGLGTPKQEIWMAEHRGRLGGVTMLGVGAAFDIYAGLIARAPVWMQKAGLEWAFRLAHEPLRLWKRYLVLAPMFVILVFFDALRSFTRRFYRYDVS